jgi:predicted enzyme related to lactoylglutathione lyase
MSNQCKLAVINIPANDPEKASKFYSNLLALEFTRSPTDAAVSYSAPISEDGVYISIKKKERPDETIGAFFAVENLTEAIATFQSAGGKVISKHDLPISPKVQKEYAQNYTKVYGPRDGGVPTTMGHCAVVTDHEGNRIGLIEVEEHAHVMFKMGKHAMMKTDMHRATQEAAKNLEKAFVSAENKSKQ